MTRKHVVDAFIEAIQTRPRDFSIGPHTINDKATGMQFWIANGFPFYGVYEPYKMNFGFIQGFRFGWWVNKFKSVTAAHALRSASKPSAERTDP